MAIALIALAGTAYAIPSPVTVKIDKVQVNGVYQGVPTPESGGNGIGYEYVLTPDGTYTVFGTMTNRGNDPVKVRIGGGTTYAPEDIQYIDVPGSGTASFTLNFWAANNDDVHVGYWVVIGEEDEHDLDWIMLDMSNTDFVNMPDNKVHTVDEGPMSDLFVVFANGAFDFGSSVLYSFVK
jgi:hypothetical protein